MIFSWADFFLDSRWGFIDKIALGGLPRLGRFLDRFWIVLGGVLGCILEAFWRRLGASWGRLGAVSGRLESSWGVLEGVFKVYWRCSAAFWRFHDTHLVWMPIFFENVDFS